MASIRKELVTRARPDDVWDAIADIGALHRRLVPGFVVDTALEQGGRRVRFASGLEVFEPIVDLDSNARRLVWSAVGAGLTHYNASVQVFAEGEGARVVWIADLLPHEMAGPVGVMMTEGMAAMQAALDRSIAPP